MCYGGISVHSQDLALADDIAAVRVRVLPFGLQPGVIRLH